MTKGLCPFCKGFHDTTEWCVSADHEARTGDAIEVPAYQHWLVDQIERAKAEVAGVTGPLRCDNCKDVHYTLGGCAGKPLSGGSNDYWKVHVGSPVSGGDAYTAECNDLIEALQMTYAEGNVFKAVWRHALARRGIGKQGNTQKYEAEKAEFFAKRLVELTKG